MSNTLSLLKHMLPPGYTYQFSAIDNCSNTNETADISVKVRHRLWLQF